jgi:hypothetical protein
VRILLVHNAYLRPGGEDVVSQQERGLLERFGYHVSVNRRTNDELKGQRRFGSAAATVWLQRTTREFEILPEREVSDVVHVHNTITLISPLIFWASATANTLGRVRDGGFDAFGQPPNRHLPGGNRLIYRVDAVRARHVRRPPVVLSSSVSSPIRTPPAPFNDSKPA